jgi:hypothetical protein
MTGKSPISKATLIDCVRSIALRRNIDPVQGWIWSLEGALSRELPDVQFTASGLLPPIPGMNTETNDPAVTLEEMRPDMAAAWRQRITSDLAFLQYHQNIDTNFGHVYRRVWVDPIALTDLFTRKLRAAKPENKRGPKPTTHDEMRTALSDLKAEGHQFKSMTEAHKAVCERIGKKTRSRGYEYDTFRRACFHIPNAKQSAN